MQTMRSSRGLSHLNRRKHAAMLTSMRALRAWTTTNTNRLAIHDLRHQQAPVSTSTTAAAAAAATTTSYFGDAVRPSTTDRRTTQVSCPSLARVPWKLSVESLSGLWHGCGHNTDSCGLSGVIGTAALVHSSSRSIRSGDFEARAAALVGGISIDSRLRGNEPASVFPSVVLARGRASVPRRGMSSSTISEREFHSVADEALEEIHDAVEEALEDGFEDEFDCHMSQGVLNIVVGNRGTWVLNKQSPNRQIWWSSPISGPMRFEYHEDSKRWLNTRDGETELRVILATEMSEKCGVSL